MIEVKPNNAETLKVYSKNKTDFASNKNLLAALRRAKDVCMSLSADGEYSLRFSLPQDDPGWQYITYECLVKCAGQFYRVKSVDGTTVNAQAVYKDAAFTFLENVGDMLGKKPREIMTVLFEGTDIHVLTETEAEALGLEWVDATTDFFETSKLNPIGGLKQLMDMLAKYKHHAELYVDNYNIALVKQIGTDKTHIKLSTDRNAKELTRSWDTSQMITRLYAYGKDDLPMGQTVYGKNFVQSPEYDQYPRDGFMTFDEIEIKINGDETSEEARERAVKELIDAAKQQFAEGNPNRIDKPNITFNVQFLDTGNETIGLGDTVTLVDADGGTYTRRVVSMEVYPFERQRNTITTGKMPTTINDVITDLVGSYRKTQIHTNAKGELKTGWLEMMQKNKSVTINKQLKDQEIALYKTGALFEATDGSCAVAIIQGNLAISYEKVGDDWNWTTIMDGGQVIVGEVFTGTLHTDNVTVKSSYGKLSIEDGMIRIKDENDVRRLEMGYQDGQYVFIMYADDGNKTMYFDDGGNLTMTGVFQTGPDGARRTVIDGNGIQSYNANNKADGLYANSSFENDFGDAADIHQIALYDNGNALFKVFKGSMGTHMSLDGSIFLTCDDNVVRFGKTLMYNGSEIATQKDIKNLQNQIDALKGV